MSGIWFELGGGVVDEGKEELKVLNVYLHLRVKLEQITYRM